MDNPKDRSSYQVYPVPNSVMDLTEPLEIDMSLLPGPCESVFRLSPEGVMEVFENEAGTMLGRVILLFG